MSSNDPQVIGWWKVQSIAMPEGRTLGLIGGLPGERVCFSQAGNYHVFPRDDNMQLYRCLVAEPYRELDIWIRGLEPLVSLCIYAIYGEVLKITVAGRPLGDNPKEIKRPTEMRMDEQQNWVLIEMKRCRQPKGRGSGRSGWKLESGRFIPEGFLGEPKSGGR